MKEEIPFGFEAIPALCARERSLVSVSLAVAVHIRDNSKPLRTVGTCDGAMVGVDASVMREHLARVAKSQD